MTDRPVSSGGRRVPRARAGEGCGDGIAGSQPGAARASSRQSASSSTSKSIAEIVHDLGIAESCLRRWLKQDDIDTGRAAGLSTAERAELFQLRRENREQAMEIDILKRASAYFAREALPGPK